jgi:ribose transport system substrate-binding protein
MLSVILAVPEPSTITISNKMMNLKKFATLSTALTLGLSCLIDSASAQENPTTFITRANAKVARESAVKSRWEGPTSGPKIEAKKLIIFIASDFRNTSVNALLKNLREVSAITGWDLVAIDCWGAANKRADAFSRAMALKPNGIILAGINAQDQAKEIAKVNEKKIPIVGWHASTKIGPADGLFVNIGTDPKEVGQTAAYLTVTESNGKAGVVVFTDPTTLYSVAKSNEVIDVIKRCQTCSILGVEEIPITNGAEQLSASIATLSKRHGKKWTHSIVVHDQYIDWMETPSNIELLGDIKPLAVAAGDGTSTSYARIQRKALQIGVIPEPLGQHAWQLFDELNRAQHNLPPSGYVSTPYVVTVQNIAFHGGPKQTFDPDNGYRNEYRKIWGK